MEIYHIVPQRNTFINKKEKNSTFICNAHNSLVELGSDLKPLRKS